MNSCCQRSDWNRLELLPEYEKIVDGELEFWHSVYLPANRPDALKDRVVVDLGAGCGETAFFFLKHGARFVYCFESDPAVQRVLDKNYGDNPRVLVLRERVDFIKVDIEGDEENMVVESHFPASWKHTSSTTWRLVRVRGIAGILNRYSWWHRFHFGKIRVAHRIRLTIDWFKPRELRKWK